MNPKISRRLKMLCALVAMAFVHVSTATAAPAVSFTGPTFYTVGQDPGNVVVRDLNGDGILDLVTPLYGAGAVSVLLGNGNGFFTELPAYGVGSNPTWLL